MTIKKGSGVKWHETMVVLREDILMQVQASGLDLSDLCNRALAGATGIDYPPKKSASIIPAAPVIVAQDGGPVTGNHIPIKIAEEEIRPVINADDPRAATAMKQAPKPKAQKTPAVLPGRDALPAKPVVTPAVPSAVPPAKKTNKPEPVHAKKGKGPAIKRFVAETIIREDADENFVTKDALYKAFSQWCREHRITMVPDRKALTVALKNQFAMKEKSVDGEPSWMNVRLR